mmetsp:Transcript_75024/g.139989  ORF Transcript_75024/g.139989 Transcript_75024/m.139989 type:complete len:147 (-) Transcript_75024:37-477(-)
MAVRALCFLLAACLAAADLGPSTTHKQSPGVKTCEEMGGTCSFPAVEPELDLCPDGGKVHEFAIKCDSGCGYWRGKCGQPCCVPTDLQNKASLPPAADSSHILNINTLSLLGVCLICVALVAALRPSCRGSSGRTSHNTGFLSIPE